MNLNEALYTLAASGGETWEVAYIAAEVAAHIDAARDAMQESNEYTPAEFGQYVDIALRPIPHAFEELLGSLSDKPFEEALEDIGLIVGGIRARRALRRTLVDEEAAWRTFTARVDELLGIDPGLN